MERPPLETERLRLKPRTLEETRAAIEMMTPAERSQLSPEWLTQIQTATSASVWELGFTIVLREGGTPVGQAGFKGRPTDDGVVEIAYAIEPAFQGKGFATEAAQALVKFARDSSEVRVIRAHTLPEKNASARVLTKCGFKPIGEIIDPEDGLVWRWEAMLAAA